MAGAATLPRSQARGFCLLGLTAVVALTQWQQFLQPSALHDRSLAFVNAQGNLQRLELRDVNVALQNPSRRGSRDYQLISCYAQDGTAVVEADADKDDFFDEIAASNKDVEDQATEGIIYEEDEDDDWLGEKKDAEEKERPSVRCKAKFLKGSQWKYKRILWQIKGRTYRESLMILEFLPWRQCKQVLTCLQSAAANAQNTYNMDKSRLFVYKATAWAGPKMKRFRPASKGQAHPYVKHLAHMEIRVAELEDEELTITE